MSKTYKTVQGDMWDSIAQKEMGDCKYANILMEANVSHIFNYIFPAGVSLTIPEITESIKEEGESLPPWKR